MEKTRSLVFRRDKGLSSSFKEGIEIELSLAKSLAKSLAEHPSETWTHARPLRKLPLQAPVLSDPSGVTFHLDTLFSTRVAQKERAPPLRKLHHKASDPTKAHPNPLLRPAWGSWLELYRIQTTLNLPVCRPQVRHDLLDEQCFIARDYPKQVCTHYAISPPTRGSSEPWDCSNLSMVLQQVRGYARRFTLILGHRTLLFGLSSV